MRELKELKELKEFQIISGAIPEDVAQRFLAVAENLFPSERSTCRVYGKTYPIPRDQIVIGRSAGYEYSGHQVHTIHNWPPEVNEIKIIVESLWPTPINFSYAFLNGYHPEDKIGVHQDNESSIDQRFPIASVTFGAERPFDVWGSDASGKINKSVKWRAVLPSRSVVFMRPGVQSKYWHAVPQCKRAAGRRYNLTFRVESKS